MKSHIRMAILKSRNGDFSITWARGGFLFLPLELAEFDSPPVSDGHVIEAQSPSSWELGEDIFQNTKRIYYWLVLNRITI